MDIASLAIYAGYISTIISTITTAIQNGKDITEVVMQNVTSLTKSFQELVNLAKAGVAITKEQMLAAEQTFLDLLTSLTEELHDMGIMSSETRELLYKEYKAKTAELLKGTDYETTSETIP